MTAKPTGRQSRWLSRRERTRRAQIREAFLLEFLRQLERLRLRVVSRAGATLQLRGAAEVTLDASEDDLKITVMPSRRFIRLRELTVDYGLPISEAVLRLASALNPRGAVATRTDSSRVAVTMSSPVSRGSSDSPGPVAPLILTASTPLIRVGEGEGWFLHECTPGALIRLRQNPALSASGIARCTECDALASLPPSRQDER